MTTTGTAADTAATLLHYPRTSVGALPTAMAAAYGDRAAIVDGERTTTYRELDERSGAVAAALHEKGVGRGSVVLLHLGNSAEFAVVYYGALRAGATVTLTNPLQPVPGLRSQIAETGARVAFSENEGYGRVLDAADGTDLAVVVVGAEAAERGAVTLAEFTAGAGASPPLAIEPDDVAHLAYTGGTTGASKGVRVLHRNVIANVTQMIAWRAGHAVVEDAEGIVHLEPRDDAGVRGVDPGAAATVVVSPLFHAHALINMSFLLLCGATQVLAGRFDPGRMLELVERHRATYITGSPAMWHALATHPDVRTRDLSSVRVVSSGAAPIDRVTLEALAAAFPGGSVVEGYGLTEATCLVASAPLTADGEYRIGSVGLPTFDTEIEIREVGGSGPALGPGERGGLWVRGPQVTDGYLGHPEITAHQYVDGWLDTGDVAYKDEDGYVYICDRAKDMLIYKGYNVYPRELEEILVTHPDVSEAAVVGREVGAVGQEPVAFVVPAAGRAIDEDKLMAFVAEQVVPYKKVRDVIVVPSLPVSAAGKIQKVELRRRVS